jgi:hypothetical protein
MPAVSTNRNSKLPCLYIFIAGFGLLKHSCLPFFNDMSYLLKEILTLQDSNNNICLRQGPGSRKGHKTG